ncbi:RagB/SusD family nutrient uptake outer membrane protein [Ichthyobacterium seriolicida]|nr:RagB/SusD family nutrient uptake outer membrane protein [Ichthyobacterium seriolicida]
MKKYIVLLLLLTSSSCVKDILDSPKSNSILYEDAFKTKDGVEAFMSGIIRNLSMYKEQYYEGHGYVALHSVYLARTVKGDDIIMGKAGDHFSDDSENNDRDKTADRSHFTWGFFYSLINQLNVFIKNVEDASILEVDEKDKFLSESRVLRAYCYFQLSMEFQSAYSNNSSSGKPSLPIYKKPSNKTSVGKKFSTLEDVYAFIKAELKESIPKLKAARINKSYINSAVANGIYARVLQVTQDDWAACETAALNALGGKVDDVLNSKSYTTGFDDISNSEWIWGMDQTDKQHMGVTVMSSFFEPTGRAYSSLFINKEFVSKFTDTDVRKLFIKNGSDESEPKLYTTNKFKFKFKSDMVLMRTSEMMLIVAEAKFRQDKGDAAHDMLYKLQKNRDPSAAKSANTGDALMEEILLERRKELYGEMGVEWFDAKRLGRPIVRSGNHMLAGRGFDLTANDVGFYLMIPEKEIDANDNVTDDINNDR